MAGLKIPAARAPGSLHPNLARQAPGLALSARGEALPELVGETGGLGRVAVKAVLMFAVAATGLRPDMVGRWTLGGANHDRSAVAGLAGAG